MRFSTDVLEAQCEVIEDHGAFLHDEIIVDHLLEDELGHLYPDKLMLDGKNERIIF